MRDIYQAIILLAMEKLTKRLSRKLKTLRGERTQREFARKLGISYGSLNRIEQGTQNITLATLQIICDHLKCDIDYLFKDDHPH